MLAWLLSCIAALTHAPATSCTSVAHIGDSTSVGMMSPHIDSSERLDAQYARVGVSRVVIESAGGRSLREYRRGRENGVMVAKRLRESGFTGCWVIAIGTNDAANVGPGEGSVAGVNRATRIARMMAVIGDDPVMWVDAITVTDSGAYTRRAMDLWSLQLASTLSAYPHAKVYPWSKDARPGWFQRDGIHYTRTGSVARARSIADALASSFPAGGMR